MLKYLPELCVVFTGGWQCWLEPWKYECMCIREYRHGEAKDPSDLYAPGAAYLVSRSHSSGKAWLRLGIVDSDGGVWLNCLFTPIIFAKSLEVKELPSSDEIRLLDVVRGDMLNAKGLEQSALDKYVDIYDEKRKETAPWAYTVHSRKAPLQHSRRTRIRVGG